jgi:ketosteroid isomerase-like protein
MSEQNVEIVHRFQEAVGRGDRESTARLIHPEVEWHTMAAPLLGVEAVRGRDETVSFIFDRIPEGIEDFKPTVDRISELPDGRLIAVGHYAGRGVSSGAAIEITSAAIYRFEGGMIASFQDFASEAEALQAAGLGE